MQIDGSQGEGGGQVLRSSLALSMCTGKPFEMVNIRAKRAKPGLMRQHLTCVRAAAAVCSATVTGDAIKSTALTFTPGEVRGGEHTFAVGTAGSTMLVMQTVLPALLTVETPSRLVLEGGTHNPAAPPFDFLAESFLPLIERMGPRVTATLERPGFYPAGGGRVVVEIEPVKQLKNITLLDRGKRLPIPSPPPEGLASEPIASSEGETVVPTSGHQSTSPTDLPGVGALVLVSDLPEVVAERELKEVARKMNWPASVMWTQMYEKHGPGNVLVLFVRHAEVTNVFTAFGEPGMPSEMVAKKACKSCGEFLKHDAPVGLHLADQLMVPMALAAWRDQSAGAFRTVGLTRHAETQLDVIGAFLAGEKGPVLVAEDDPRGGVRVVARVADQASAFA